MNKKILTLYGLSLLLGITHLHSAAPSKKLAAPKLTEAERTALMEKHRERWNKQRTQDEALKGKLAQQVSLRRGSPDLTHSDYELSDTVYDALIDPHVLLRPELREQAQAALVRVKALAIPVQPQPPIVRATEKTVPSFSTSFGNWTMFTSGFAKDYKGW